MDPLPLSISIVAPNEEENVGRCLASADGLARELVVIDAGSDVFLDRQLESGKCWSFISNPFRPFWRFLRGYILRRGSLDGFPGYRIARSTAFSAFVRYSRTEEHQVKDRIPPGLSRPREGEAPKTKER